MLALAASICGHAAVLANAGFASDAMTVALLASGQPLRARLAPQAAAESTAQVAQQVAPAPAAPAGLPVPEIYYRGSEVDERAEAINDAEVEYPEGALTNRMLGKVTLRLRIDRLGQLRDASVLESQPPGVFDEVALKAAKSLRFKPALRGGVPVGSIKVIEVPFEPDCHRSATCSN